MTNDELATIEARATAATPDEWKSLVDEDGFLLVCSAHDNICGFGDMEDTEEQDHKNARFVAYGYGPGERYSLMISKLDLAKAEDIGAISVEMSRKVRDLLKENERLTTEIRRLRNAIKQWASVFREQSEGLWIAAEALEKLLGEGEQ
jgi:hypothetical protein